MNDVIHGDCLQVMKGFKDNEFDLCLTDPPYGIGMDGGNVGYKGFNNFKKKDWDNKTPEKKYFDEIMRISKNQVIWGGNYFIDHLKKTRCMFVWDKGEGFYNRTYAECEIAWTNLDMNTKIFKHDPLAKGDYRGKKHPTQKPTELFSWVLEITSKEGDLIIDPFAGSGSTAISCINMNRKYTLIEKEKEYIDIINKRIANHLDGNLLQYIENE